MTDFPRGWRLTADSFGGLATVTAPAIAGVAHVLDSVSAKMANNSAALSQLRVVVSSSDGTFNNTLLFWLSAPAGAADSESAADLGLVAGPGESLTVAFSAGVANVLQVLELQGHDI